MNTKLIAGVLLIVATIVSYAEQAELSSVRSEVFINDGMVQQFAVIGDYGNNSKNERNIAKRVHAVDPDYVITLGDNNYPDGCWKTIDKNIGKYYSSFIGNYQGEYGEGSAVNRFYPSIGNHDWNAKDKCLHHGSLPYLSYFTLPDNALYYDFQKGAIHFFVLDSDDNQPDGNTKGSKQYHWLQQKMAVSTACFKVVYFHHAPYSSGEHGSNKEMHWDFDRLGADVVMAGHDHGYERLHRDGVVYIVNGAGGADLRDFEKKAKGSVYRYSKKHGYMLVKANDHHMQLQFYNEDNSLKDSIMLTKLCR